MFAGTAKIDITPSRNVWMAGMLRAHRSEGVHDPLFARALVLANSEDRAEAFAIVSLNVCYIGTEQANSARAMVEAQTDIPASQIMLAGSHTHSGPATVPPTGGPTGVGDFTSSDLEYVEELLENIVTVVDEAVGNIQPVAIGVGSGHEDTISHYRRLLADDGSVVMNWEPFPPDRIEGPLGEVDPEVGVVKVVAADNPDSVAAILFNHAGHPNVLSGDNYLLSGDYTGLAERLLEEQFGGTALFVNGAQGTMDIDGLRDRDWEGMQRTGQALAAAVAQTARDITPSNATTIRGASTQYHLPARKITDEELTWAAGILEQTGGDVAPLADGIGDDRMAKLYKELHEVEDQDIQVEQLCFAIDGTALLSFPGEMFTEIGMAIKKQSPFEHTYIVGVTNGHISYLPTRKAIGEGGMAVDVRRFDAGAEDIVMKNSLALLKKLYALSLAERQ